MTMRGATGVASQTASGSLAHVTAGTGAQGACGPALAHTCSRPLIRVRFTQLGWTKASCVSTNARSGGPAGELAKEIRCRGVWQVHVVLAWQAKRGGGWRALQPHSGPLHMGPRMPP